MNEAIQLLAEARSLGLTFKAEGDKLRYHPRRRMTPDLAARLQENKADLLVLLAKPKAAGSFSADPPSPPQPDASASEPSVQATGHSDQPTPPLQCRRCGGTSWRDEPRKPGSRSKWRRCRACGAIAGELLWLPFSWPRPPVAAEPHEESKGEPTAEGQGEQHDISRNHSNIDAPAKSWNPFKGCEFNCTYCAAASKARTRRHKRLCRDCYDHVPHHHNDRLAKIPSAPVIFVAPNADISFCDYPFMGTIIDRIKEHNKWRPNKTYYFQSKRPDYFAPLLPQFPENVVLGTTLETNRDQGYGEISKAPPPSLRYGQFKALEYPRKMVMVEPMMDFDVDEFSHWIVDLKPEYVWLGFNRKPNAVSLPEPPPNKVAEFMEILVQAGIPVRGKTLRGLEVPEVAA